MIIWPEALEAKLPEVLRRYINRHKSLFGHSQSSTSSPLNRANTRGGNGRPLALIAVIPSRLAGENVRYRVRHENIDWHSVHARGILPTLRVRMTMHEKTYKRRTKKPNGRKHFGLL